jgi:hypothetical protein
MIIGSYKGKPKKGSVLKNEMPTGVGILYFETPPKQQRKNYTRKHAL